MGLPCTHISYWSNTPLVLNSHWPELNYWSCFVIEMKCGIYSEQIRTQLTSEDSSAEEEGENG